MTAFTFSAAPRHDRPALVQRVPASASLQPLRLFDRASRATIARNYYSRHEPQDKSKIERQKASRIAAQRCGDELKFNERNKGEPRMKIKVRGTLGRNSVGKSETKSVLMHVFTQTIGERTGASFSNKNERRRRAASKKRRNVNVELTLLEKMLPTTKARRAALT